MKNVFKKLSVVLAIAIMTAALAGCGGKGGNTTASSTDASKFPTFSAKDFQGNQFTQEMFKDSPVTVLNLWFTGCEACVSEMPQLEKLSKDLKEKGVALAGVCTDAGMDKDIAAEAKKILKQNNVTYTNIVMDQGDEIDKYMMNIMAFPTTLLIDRDGNIVGESITGSLDTQEQIDNLNKRIDEIIANEKQ